MSANLKSPGGSKHSGSLVSLAEVHKRRAEHVWLTTATQTAENVLEAAFHIPFRQEGPRFADLMEVQRQAGIVQAHRQLRISTSDVFVLNSIALILRSTATRPRANRGTAAVRLTSPHAKEAHQHFSMTMDAGGTASGSSRARFVPLPIYERLRRARRQKDLRDVPHVYRTAVVSPLAADTGDPLLSDHSSDHTSAMEVVCGIEHLIAEKYGELRLTSLSLDFTSYGEIGSTPLLLHFALNPLYTFSGLVSQDNSVRVTFSGAATVREAVA